MQITVVDSREQKPNTKIINIDFDGGGGGARVHYDFPFLTDRRCGKTRQLSVKHMVTRRFIAFVYARQPMALVVAAFMITRDNK